MKFWVQKSYSEHPEKREFYLLVKEIQLHDKDYFFCYFRMPSVAFDKLLCITARDIVVFRVCTPEFSNFIKNSSSNSNSSSMFLKDFAYLLGILIVRNISERLLLNFFFQLALSLDTVSIKIVLKFLRNCEKNSLFKNRKRYELNSGEIPVQELIFIKGKRNRNRTLL